MFVLYKCKVFKLVPYFS